MIVIWKQENVQNVIKTIKSTFLSFADANVSTRTMERTTREKRVHIGKEMRLATTAFMLGLLGSLGEVQYVNIVTRLGNFIGLSEQIRNMNESAKTLLNCVARVTKTTI